MIPACPLTCGGLGLQFRVEQSKVKRMRTAGTVPEDFLTHMSGTLIIPGMRGRDQADVGWAVWIDPGERFPLK